MQTVKQAYDAWDETGDPPLAFMEFMESEGGHKCVVCCKYRREDDLFIVGGTNHGHILTAQWHIAITAQPVCSACLDMMKGEGGAE